MSITELILKESQVKEDLCKACKIPCCFRFSLGEPINPQKVSSGISWESWKHSRFGESLFLIPSAWTPDYSEYWVLCGMRTNEGCLLGENRPSTCHTYFCGDDETSESQQVKHPLSPDEEKEWQARCKECQGTCCFRFSVGEPNEQEGTAEKKSWEKWVSERFGEALLRIPPEWTPEHSEYWILCSLATPEGLCSIYENRSHICREYFC